MQQDRLFRLAVEAGSINFRHEPGRGWVLNIVLRRGDEDWSSIQPETYSHLTTVELLDAVAAHLDGAL